MAMNSGISVFMNALTQGDDKISPMFFTLWLHKSHGLSVRASHPWPFTLADTTSETLSSKHFKNHFTISKVKNAGPCYYR